MLAELSLQERAYYSGADCTIRLEDHPDPSQEGRVIDAAFFQLTAGDTPMPIYSYARRWGRMQGPNTGGRQGGNAFDDVALSNRLVQLELILNQERFKSYRYALTPMTHIGHLRLEYTRHAWSGRKTTGYLLARGRVQRAGYEVTVSGATFPAISIVFDDVFPIVGGQVLEETAFGEEPEAVVEVGAPEAALSAVEFTSFRVFYRASTGPEREYGTAYSGAARSWPTEPGLALTRCVRSGAQTLQLFGGVADVLTANGFAGGVVAVEDDLWVWSPRRAGGAGYVRLEARYTEAEAQAGRIEGDLLGEAATILFGY